nr:uncharacterized protein CTRU02_15184 [Colletotrichum truncatum]KAF6781334.1 hypothetical protein CTRU02_15184 [Colletotrichum truncatum]
MPSGGGAIKGMKEASDVNLVSGSVTMSVPISVTASSRWGMPNISLSYDSGAGNGPFGLEWHLLGLPAIERKTANGLPTYEDGIDRFMLNGNEIVPLFEPDGLGDWKMNDDGTYKLDQRLQDGHQVCKYSRCVDHSFERIEKWTNAGDPADVHWRVLSSKNETQIFGGSKDSRVAQGPRVFRWLLCESYDKHVFTGNGIGPQAYQVRKHDKHRGEDWNTVASSVSLKYLFEVVFDYAEHANEVEDACEESPSGWPVRSDPFSVYTPGFELRTYHLVYTENANISFLESVCQTGYTTTASTKTVTSTRPPMEFEYTSAPQAIDLQQLTFEAFYASSVQSIPTNTFSEIQWVDLAGDGTTGILGQSNNAWRSTNANTAPMTAVSPGFPMPPSNHGHSSIFKARNYGYDLRCGAKDFTNALYRHATLIVNA